VLVDHHPVAAEVLIQGDALVRESQQPGQTALSVLDWLGPYVLAVHFE
jgi:hypothetical protein